MALGINPYEENQMLLSAQAITKARAKEKPVVTADSQYADEGSIYRKEDLDAFYSSNLGYLVASGVKAAENIFKTGALATGQFEAIEEMESIKVNPENVNGAVRIIGDIGQTMLPFFIPGIGLEVGAATMAGTTGIESVEAGMDAGTAGMRTAFAGGSAVAMAAINPLSGKALGALMEGKTLSSVLEVGKSAVYNVGIGTAQRAIDYQIVKTKYPEFAEKMEVLGSTTVGTDIAMWGLFAGLGYKGIRTEMKKAGYSITDANKAIRAAEEVAGADTAVNDAIYTRRANKSYEDDGPLLSQEEYAVKRAAIDEAIARIEKADPLPEEVPEAIKADTPPVEYFDKAPVSEAEVTKFVTDFGIDNSRVVMHNSDNMPDYAVEAAMREGGDINTAEAWMGSDGILHINLDAFSDMNRLKDVVGFHEITHAGQDANIIKKAHAALFEAKGEKTDFLRGEMDRIAKQRGYDMTTEEGTNRAVKEATADAMMDAVYRGHVADIMNESYFSKLISAVKNMLRDMGVKIEYTDEDAARLIGTMWYRGKKELESKAPVDWKTTLQGLEQETYTRVGNKDGAYYTESAFQAYLKEFYPSVHGGQYDKKDVIATLKNLAKGSNRKLTDKQKEIKANFERDLDIASKERVQVDEDLPFSIAPKTDTPEFKRWFGDSKVVDEQGKPLVVYHGTRGDFNVFRKRIFDGPMFFSTDASFAGDYAGDIVSKAHIEALREGRPSVMPVYISIKNLFDFRNATTVDRVVQMLPDNEYPQSIKAKMAEEIKQGAWNRIESLDMQEAMQKAGYDGFTVLESDNQDNMILNYGVFEPTQIKSATGNRGTFDPTDPRIDFSMKPAKDMEGTVKVEELTADGEIEKVVRPAKEVVKEYQETLSKLSGLLDCLRGA